MIWELDVTLGILNDPVALDFSLAPWLSAVTSFSKKYYISTFDFDSLILWNGFNFFTAPFFATAKLPFGSNHLWR